MKNKLCFLFTFLSIFTFFDSSAQESIINQNEKTITTVTGYFIYQGHSFNNYRSLKKYLLSNSDTKEIFEKAQVSYDAAYIPIGIAALIVGVIETSRNNAPKPKSTSGFDIGPIFPNAVLIYPITVGILTIAGVIKIFKSKEQTINNFNELVLSQ